MAKSLGGYALTAADQPTADAEWLSPHEVPARAIYISAVDWTRDDVSPEAPLRLTHPNYETANAPQTYLHARRGNRPIPKARITLCSDDSEVLAADETPRTPLFEMFSPLPTLRLDVRDERRLFDDARIAILAMTSVETDS
ncbi:MAG: hypothetical protein QM811_20200 [Pirellulales bacterium]